MRIRDEWLDTWDEHRVDVRLHPRFKVRDRKVSYLYEHTDSATALEAAGLREEDLRPAESGN